MFKPSNKKKQLLRLRVDQKDHHCLFAFQRVQLNSFSFRTCSSRDDHSLFAQSLRCWIWCNPLQPPPVCLKVSASGKQRKSRVTNGISASSQYRGRTSPAGASADAARTLDGGSVSFGLLISGNLRNSRRRMLARLHTAEGHLLNVSTYSKCLYRALLRSSLMYSDIRPWA